MAQSATASAAFRYNVLFVQYSGSSDQPGRLFALTPLYGLPGEGGDGTLIIRPQYLLTPNATDTVRFQGIENPTTPARFSMVSTFVRQNSTLRPVRHDLLIAVTPSSNQTSNPPARPSLFRLVPQAPSIGDGRVQFENASPGARYRPYIESAVWAVERVKMEDALLVPANATSLSIEFEIAERDPDINQMVDGGGAVVELYLGDSGYMLQKTFIYKLDASGSSIPELAWKKDLTFLNATVESKVARHQGSRKENGVVVGQCAGPTTDTCLGIYDTKGDIHVVKTNATYDPDSCVAIFATKLVMVTPSQALEFTIPFNHTDLAESGTWTSHPLGHPLADKNTPIDKILACAPTSHHILAVMKGNDSMPAISILKLPRDGEYSNAPDDWTWRPSTYIQAWDIKVDEYWPKNENENKDLSTGALVGIIVASVVVVAGIVGGLIWYRRQRRGQSSTTA
ncbi:MAG: hypothetical protein J3Q66DRAFT_373433 [Benniella sp.]|nr:MAG: hypothetical protein J3Q66DRAFT_373433 [Benniella sp.]